jgi:hypothetical protein
MEGAWSKEQSWVGGNKTLSAYTPPATPTHSSRLNDTNEANRMAEMRVEAGHGQGNEKRAHREQLGPILSVIHT